MPNKKQKDIQFCDSIGNYSTFVNTMKKNEKKIWNIDDDFGKINIYSRLHPSTIQYFYMEESIANVLKKPLSNKKCTDQDCLFFKKIHKLTDPIAQKIWKKIPKKEQEIYNKMAEAEPDTRKRCLALFEIELEE